MREAAARAKRMQLPRTPRSRSRSRVHSVRTRSSSFQVLAAAALTFLLHFLAGSQLEPHLNSESVSLLDAPMSSGAVHRRFACMGCTARTNGSGEPTFFNDYQSAASHYARSSHCNRSMRGIKSVAVQLNTCPQYVGGGEAGAGGAAGPWRPQPAPSRRPGAMI
jgi:hypothetical protein